MKSKKKSKSDLSFILGIGGTAKGVGTFLGMGCLSLQNMKTRGPIGGGVEKDNLVDGASTVYFVTEDAVTRLIKELTKMRGDMAKARKGAPKKSKKLEIIINATDYKSNGHPEHEREAPKPRAKR